MHATPEPPIEPGQTLIVHPHDIAFGGEGVARHQEFVVFVPFVLPGETAEITVTEVRKHYARGRLERIVEPSPDRVTPPW